MKARNSGDAGFSVSGDFYAPDESAIDLDFSGVTVTIIEPVTPTPEVASEPTPELTLEPFQGPTPTQTLEPFQEPTPTSEPTFATTQTPSPQNTPEPTPIVTNISAINKEQETNKILSSNTNLKSLRLDVAIITPEFKPDILNYEAVLDEKTDNIDVLAVPENTNSSIEITGNNELKIGLNLIQVTVFAENGDKKTYNITVNKTTKANESNSFLENLAIEDVFLIPEFRFDEFSYKAELASTQEKINILAVPQVEGATVDIQGYESINFGKNNIVVTVTAKDGNNTSTYTIEIYRKTLEEELLENENMISNTDFIENEAKTLNVSKQNNILIIVLTVFLTIGTFIILGIFIWKYNKK